MGTDLKSSRFIFVALAKGGFTMITTFIYVIKVGNLRALNTYKYVKNYRNGFKYVENRLQAMGGLRRKGHSHPILTFKAKNSIL